MSAGCRAHSPYLADTKVPSTDAGKPSGPGARCLLIEKTTSLISSPSILSDKASYIELGFEVAYTSTIPYDARYHDLVSGPTSPRSRGVRHMNVPTAFAKDSTSSESCGPNLRLISLLWVGSLNVSLRATILMGTSRVFEVRGCFPLLKGEGVASRVPFFPPLPSGRPPHK
ncbi:unnamed protein product [Spirodela intermedia]|uniref:Uncharacterized protein n=1 Tax=Spirodela intermedia TaxID=51605 RepID=A0A811G4Y4_SPIIN|nr:unnamed protein product [Spirodela intermedia]